MTLNKTHLIVFIVGAVLGLLTGFFSGKAIYDRPSKESVKRDTVTRVDTIFQYFPKPVEVEKVRTEYKWLTKVMTDTLVKTDVITCHDSVLVEVPITSKHYHGNEYDAYISGYMPSLDSISVYQRTEYITETITRMKPPNRFSIGIQGGYGYGFRSKIWEPYVGVGLGIRIF